MKKTLLLLLAVCGSLSGSFAATWYVNTNATGANTGTTWTDAFTDLQNAITASNFGDEIWVAAGTYKPTTTTARNIYFSIKNGTEVYGGFTGSETLLSERDPAANVTILSGEIGTGATTDNTYHVVYFGNVGNQTRIEGFTITAGRATSVAGGGIYSTDSSPTIANCRILGNYAEDGGGLSHRNSGILTVTDCVFDGNVCDERGGAVYLAANTSNFTGCYFKSNQSGNVGGAVYMDASSDNFDRCVFAGNISDNDGSVLYLGIAGILTLSNSLLVGNYAGGEEAISSMPLSNPYEHQIINCTIAHNNQLDNGPITSTITMNDISSIRNSIIWGNGGAAQVLGTGTIMSNCIMQPGTSSASGTNILPNNPLFILPGSITAAPFDTTGLNYHLQAVSAGIDFGINADATGTTDLDGNVRIQNTVDLGAYESGYCSSVVTLNQAAPFTICSGTPLTLSVTGGVNHLWSTGSTASAITVSTAGTYTIVFEDTSGCRGSLQATVTTSSAPVPNISFSGGSLNAGSFATYQWSFNGTPINGATGSTHIPLEGYGNYTVNVTNAGGCEGSDAYCLSPAAITAGGPTTFCAGGSVTLTATNGSSFVWSNGDLDSEITVSTAGTYTVTVMNTTAGCSVTLSQAVNVIANPAPVINYSGGNLTTGTFAAYQWYFNGSPISGALSQTLTPTSGNGPYTVSVTNASGCTGTSAIYNYSNVGLNETTTGTIVLYPNPVSGNDILHIETANAPVGNTTIRLYDTAGKICFELLASEVPGTVQLPGIEPGVYFFDLTINGAVVQNQRIVVF